MDDQALSRCLLGPTSCWNAVKAPLLPLSLHLLKPLHELFLSASLLSSTQLPHPGPRSACDLRLTSFPASGYLRGGVPVLHSPGLWHVVDQLHTAERHHQPLHARSVIKSHEHAQNARAAWLLNTFRKHHLRHETREIQMAGPRTSRRTRTSRPR